ncbi:unnamed protein product [Medioppia subpectinata]|uniref:Sm domain-containing protein n=1 Tax=Medioppia subpectinata TaxID=1979941 RepID=A0A7R9KH20_9ACAR|nr:unnamed protein product [Medioppia subpectinata]CAG2103405.1 unnamed protein product [Medioppia subpectinata]
MSSSMTPKERAKSAKTLICFLQSLIGRKTRVDLRSDHHLIGVIASVDSFMNIELTNCRFHSPDNQLIQSFDYYFLKGCRIRMVHIPEEVDIIHSIESQLNVIQSRRQAVQQSVRRSAHSSKD